MSFFTVNDISAGYGRKNIINNVSFEAEKGELVGIVGANGSGKTTLLKALCGIISHKGKVLLDGEVLEDLSTKKLARICSYIPQKSGIEIEISVLDAVLMGYNPQLKLLEQPTGEMIEKAKRTLSLVGLDGMEDEGFLTLSEGQKQLVILARTLVSTSKLLLLDEPESALDFRFRYGIMKIIKKWVTEGEGAAIMTLHDGNLALNYCDRLILINGGEVIGTIFPKTDPITKTEEMLSRIYGGISIRKISKSNGDDGLVMIPEEE